MGPLPTPAGRLSAAEREHEVESAIASARAEGLDPSPAQPVFDAWVRGEIDTDQMIAAARALAERADDPRAA